LGFLVASFGVCSFRAWSGGDIASGYKSEQPSQSFAGPGGDFASFALRGDWAGVFITSVALSANLLKLVHSVAAAESSIWIAHNSVCVALIGVPGGTPRFTTGRSEAPMLLVVILLVWSASGAGFYQDQIFHAAPFGKSARWAGSIYGMG
jgi:hypothetical protein